MVLLEAEKLKSLRLIGIILKSISIILQSPITFFFIATTFILPLSVSMLALCFFTYPYHINRQKYYDHSSSLLQGFASFFVQTCYLGFYYFLIFTFSLLSVASTVFTVATLYTTKTVSFSSTFFAIRRIVWPSLFHTFLPLSFPLVLFTIFHVLLLISLVLMSYNHFFDVDFAFGVFYFILFLPFIVGTLALWQTSSVLSILEPIQGFPALKNSFELLKDNLLMAGVLIIGYLSIYWVIHQSFTFTVVISQPFKISVLFRILMGVFFLSLLVILNLIGLVVQSVFFLICKCHHNQEIDINDVHLRLSGFLAQIGPLPTSHFQNAEQPRSFLTI